MAESLNNIAYMFLLRGRIDGAIRYCRKAYVMRVRLADGRDHPDSLLCLNNLADALRLGGDVVEALIRSREALAMSLRLYEREQLHHDIVRAYYNLAGLVHDLGRVLEATELISKAMRMAVRVYGADSPYLTKVKARYKDYTRDPSNSRRAS